MDIEKEKLLLYKCILNKHETICEKNIKKNEKELEIIRKGQIKLIDIDNDKK